MQGQLVQAVEGQTPALGGCLRFWTQHLSFLEPPQVYTFTDPGTEEGEEKPMDLICYHFLLQLFIHSNTVYFASVQYRECSLT